MASSTAVAAEVDSGAEVMAQLGHYGACIGRSTAEEGSLFVKLGVAVEKFRDCICADCAIGHLSLVIDMKISVAM